MTDVIYSVPVRESWQRSMYTYMCRIYQGSHFLVKTQTIECQSLFLDHHNQRYISSLSCTKPVFLMPTRRTHTIDRHSLYYFTVSWIARPRPAMHYTRFISLGKGLHVPVTNYIVYTTINLNIYDTLSHRSTANYNYTYIYLHLCSF